MHCLLYKPYHVFSELYLCKVWKTFCLFFEGQYSMLAKLSFSKQTETENIDQISLIKFVDIRV